VAEDNLESGQVDEGLENQEVEGDQDLKMEDDAGSQNNSVAEKSEEAPKPFSKKNTNKKGGKRGGKKSTASK